MIILKENECSPGFPIVSDNVKPGRRERDALVRSVSFFLILALGFSAAVFAASGDLKGDPATSPQAGTSLPEVDSTGSLPQVKSYDQLLAAIRVTRNASQARIEAMVEKEKVRESWETGRLFDQFDVVDGAGYYGFSCN